MDPHRTRGLKMKEEDFEKHGIIHFSALEVEATGASLADVQVRLMISLQAFRVILDRRVGLVFNGMTTGSHKALEHTAGLAVDGYLYPGDGPVAVGDIVKAALTAGFHGIGIYWNGKQFSFHLDLRQDYAFWSGIKSSPQAPGGWVFDSLFFMP